MHVNMNVKKVEPTKYVILFYGFDGSLYTRKETQGDPANFLPLPVPSKAAQGQVFMKAGRVIEPKDIIIYKLIDVRQTEGLEFEEAIYIEHERRPFDMTGVSIVEQKQPYDYTAEVMGIFDELNNPSLPEKIDTRAAALMKNRGLEFNDLNEYDKGVWRMQARDMLQKEASAASDEAEDGDEAEDTGPAATGEPSGKAAKEEKPE